MLHGDDADRIDDAGRAGGLHRLIRLQGAEQQQQRDDHRQADAIDGERLVRERGDELQEPDDDDVAEQEADDHRDDGRNPAGEHAIGPGVLHGLDRFEQAGAEHRGDGHEETQAHGRR